MMTGILLIFVVWLWYLSARWMVRRMINKLPERWRHVWVKNVAFIFLLILPLGDEIVGVVQFEMLCKANSKIEVDRLKAFGKTITLETPISETYVEGTWIPVKLQRWRYVDVITKEPVVSFNILSATGGFFIRTLGISEGNAPLIFKGYCTPARQFNQFELFKELGLTNDPYKKFDK